MALLRIDRDEARRVAVRAQLLDGGPVVGRLVPLVDHLTFLQLDPTAAVAPSADLVAYTRLGAAYEPAHLLDAIERERSLFEYLWGVATVRPMADLGSYLAEMREWPPPGGRAHAWLHANERFHTHVLDQLRDSGPLLSREIEDRADVPWPSTGWTNNRNVTQMLEFLAARGEIAVDGRVGRQRRWDLAERVFPADVTVLPASEAQRVRDERRLRALGIARAAEVGEAGEEAEVDGVRGTWRVDPEALGHPFTGRTALLSPFDRLAHDRKRALELFDFEYKLELYVPKAKRRWGYFALPVLHHDQLVGKVDATADRKAGVLRVDTIHWDVVPSAELRAAVESELTALAAWIGLDGVRVG